MSGLQEILIIVLIVMAIIFLPRISGRGSGTSSRKALLTISGWLRLAIVVTVIWLIGWAAYLRPWNGEMLSFTLVGLVPVILGWGALWIIAGFRKKQGV